ncbi:MAG: T9SS type A sorting domain-containing protein [Ignavibacteria bacterium]|nr:T9SS type A sorting domain-containing protein [Ignavibacteria bacterium]
MKKLHPFISFLTAALLLLITAKALGQNCTYTWQAQNSGFAGQLTSVKAVSELVCWAGGAGAVVFLTTDGGATWLNANPNPGVVVGMTNSIDAIDGNTAWLTSTNGGNAFIYKTTNGGVLWQQVFTLPRVIFGLEMTDALNGFAFGDPIGNVWQLLLTTNGGLNWQLSPNAPSANNIEACLPGSFQVSLPNIWWGTSITTVYRSTNSGVSFTSHEANVSGIYILAIHYNSAGTGFSASISLSKSTNGGESYSSLPAPGAGNIESIQGEGENFWFIRGTGIYRSTNTGSSWEQVHTAAQTLMQMDFPDGLTGCQMGWAVGMGGGIYKMTGSLVGTGNNQNEIPETYLLKQNYPNPFNPETVIEFSIPQAGFTKLKVYDLLGNEIAELVSGELSAGNYSVNFNEANVAGGVYFYTLSSGSYSSTKKMVIIK